MNPLAAYNGIFDALLGEVSGGVDHALCREIRDILLEGFDPQWISENQKFDFSFSSPGNASFRISVNDYGEKNVFEKKIMRIFALCGDRGGGDKLAKILNVTRRTNKYHQTTFGLEWRASDPHPRIKVYFEELRHSYSIPARARLLKLICAAADLIMPRRGAKGDVAAVCVDFPAEGNVMLKSYDYSDWRHVRRGAPSSFSGLTAVLSKEKRAFFYKTRRYDRGAKLLSHKLYKVYEVHQIADFAPAVSEVYEAIGRFGARKDVEIIEKYRAFAAGRGCLWYPVLCAMDIDMRGDVKIDSYFSLRPLPAPLSDGEKAHLRRR